MSPQGHERTPPSGGAYRTPPPARRGSGTVATRYRLIGLVMGALWAWNGGEPLWEHALKLVILLFVLAPLVFWLYRRRAPRPRPGMPQLSFARLVAAKGGLLAGALGATWLLRPSLAHADLVVAAGLAVVIAFAGPLLHPYLMVTPGSRAERYAR